VEIINPLLNKPKPFVNNIIKPSWHATLKLINILRYINNMVMKLKIYDLRDIVKKYTNSLELNECETKTMNCILLRQIGRKHKSMFSAQHIINFKISQYTSYANIDKLHLNDFKIDLIRLLSVGSTIYTLNESNDEIESFKQKLKQISYGRFYSLSEVKKIQNIYDHRRFTNLLTEINNTIDNITRITNNKASNWTAMSNIPVSRNTSILLKSLKTANINTFPIYNISESKLIQIITSELVKFRKYVKKYTESTSDCYLIHDKFITKFALDLEIIDNDIKLLKSIQF